jgi:hypothetical protein
MGDTTCTKGECILKKPDGEPCASEKTQKLLHRFLVENVMPKVKKNISKREAIDMLKKTKKLSEGCLLTDENFQDSLNADERKIVKKDLDENFKQPGHITIPNALSDSQIYGVLKRWRKEFKDLAISEYAMSDFNKQGNMYDISRKSMPLVLKHGYRKYACVLNTDVTDNGGKHWVALFAEIKKQKNSEELECFIDYFDSLGRAPLDSVLEWATDNKAEMEQKLNIPTQFRYSRVVHQKENMECGVYCLYFIRKMIEGTEPEFFRTEGKTIADHKMEEFRAYIFRET